MMLSSSIITDSVITGSRVITNLVITLSVITDVVITDVVIADVDITAAGLAGAAARAGGGQRARVRDACTRPRRAGRYGGEADEQTGGKGLKVAELAAMGGPLRRVRERERGRRADLALGRGQREGRRISEAGQRSKSIDASSGVLADTPPRHRPLVRAALPQPSKGWIG